MEKDITSIPLHRIAHGRAGDKGDTANISVIAYQPEFFPLLTEQQEQFDKAITGQVSGKEALDTVAAFQDKLLREAGRIK